MLSLRYRGQTELPVEVEGIVPETVRDLSPPAIEQLPIQFGNQSVPLAELFQVEGDASDERIEWVGDLAGVHWIGAKMAIGAMRVAGSAGRHAGSRMRGGSLVIEATPAIGWGPNCGAATFACLAMRGIWLGPLTVAVPGG